VQLLAQLTTGRIIEKGLKKRSGKALTAEETTIEVGDEKKIFSCVAEGGANPHDQRQRTT
jgi:hypothetical protein